jgi:capsular exopolysaccharide synthesis family protein
MGKFFKALEQAERERALRENASRRVAPDSAVATPAPPRPEPAPVTTAPVATVPTPAAAVAAPPAATPVAPVRRVHFPEPPAPPAPVRRSPAAKRGASLAAAPERSATVDPKVEEHLVSLLDPTSIGAEQYRALRHRVEELHRSAGLTVVGISSPAPGDGKTLTALNLAGALAQSAEARVLLIDADLRRSSMTTYLGLDGSRSRGLVGAILDTRLALKDVVEVCTPYNLSVVQAGRRPSSPYELLKSPRLAQLLDEAREQYDYVILDMPPLVPLPDCSVIGRSVDGFMVVVTAHKTQGKHLKEALAVLEPAKIVGLVFNADDRAAGYVGYGLRGSRGGHSTDDEAL